MKKKVKALKTKPKFRNFILEDQSKPKTDWKDIEKLNDNIDVWWKEDCGCCGSRWKMNNVGNLDFDGVEKYKFSTEEFYELPFENHRDQITIT